MNPIPYGRQYISEEDIAAVVKTLQAEFLTQGPKIEEFEKSFSVSWHKTQYSLGGWAVYSTQERQTYYKALLQPDRQVYFAGEHMTHLNAWMAGAFESARKTVADLHARVTGQRVAYPVKQ